MLLSLRCQCSSEYFRSMKYSSAKLHSQEHDSSSDRVAKKIGGIIDGGLWPYYRVLRSKRIDFSWPSFSRFMWANGSMRVDACLRAVTEIGNLGSGNVNEEQSAKFSPRAEEVCFKDLLALRRFSTCVAENAQTSKLRITASWKYVAGFVSSFIPKTRKSTRRKHW